MNKSITILVSLFIMTISACKPDKNDGLTCVNGGTLQSDTCTCTQGYEGITCNTQWRTKFIGTYPQNNPDCGSGVQTVAGEIKAVAGDVMSLRVENLVVAGGSTISGTAYLVEADHFQIPAQTVNGYQLNTINGRIDEGGTNIWWVYQYTYQGNTYNCVAGSWIK